MTKLSIAIPCYEMKGMGAKYLQECFDSILKQTFSDYEVIISDHSLDDNIKELCAEYEDRLNINYSKNLENKGNGPYNTNHALKNCTGDIIKIIFQDDLFVDERSLEIIVDGLLNSDYKWSLCGFNHTKDGKSFNRSMIPKWTTYMLEGDNLLGGPTNFACKKDYLEEFDDNLKLCMDTEFYHRMRYNHGFPLIIQEVLVSHREHNNRISKNLEYDIFIEIENKSWDMIQSELDYIQNKHSEFCEMDERKYPDEIS
jgi:glycosyltransferase involved in cell wall biosynthesis